MNISDSILLQLKETSVAFSEVQNASKFLCPPSCGKYCFNPAVSCTPHELLPLALHLMANDQAILYKT